MSAIRTHTLHLVLLCKVIPFGSRTSSGGAAIMGNYKACTNRAGAKLCDAPESTNMVTFLPLIHAYKCNSGVFPFSVIPCSVDVAARVCSGLAGPFTSLGAVATTTAVGWDNFNEYGQTGHKHNT